jgi:hypothetical protein
MPPSRRPRRGPKPHRRPLELLDGCVEGGSTKAERKPFKFRKQESTDSLIKRLGYFLAKVVSEKIRSTSWSVASGLFQKSHQQVAQDVAGSLRRTLFTS